MTSTETPPVSTISSSQSSPSQQNYAPTTPQDYASDQATSPSTPQASRPGSPDNPLASRIFLTGFTNCGKSTLAVWLLSRAPAPRVIVDPQGSAVTDIPGVFSSADPTGRTWPAQAATIRFVPVDHLDLDTYDRLYRTVRERVTVERRWPGATVLCDESETVMPANRCPAEAAALVYRGRKWPTAHIACATRPQTIAVCLFANITHAALFPLPQKRDRELVAGNLGIPLAQLESLYAQLPPDTKSFLWWNQQTRSIRPVHSLPA